MKKLSRIGILLQNQTAFLIFCPFVVTKDRFYNNLSRLLNLQAVITSLTISNTNLGSYHMLSRFYFKRRQIFVTFKVNIVLPTQAAFLQCCLFVLIKMIIMKQLQTSPMYPQKRRYMILPWHINVHQQPILYILGK